MDNFSEFSNDKINLNISIQKYNTAIITGGAGRVGSVFTKILINNNVKVFCFSRSKKNFNNFKRSLTENEKKKFILF